MNITPIILTGLYQAEIRSKGVLARLLNKIRKLVSKCLKDPACDFRIHGVKLSMPLSHNLPLYYHRNANYDRLPGRLGAFIRETRGKIVGIDVGANIGDTIWAFSSDSHDQFLAIEPNPRYAQFLEANHRGRDNVKIVREICSSGSGDVAFGITENAGTGSTVTVTSGQQIPSRSLDQICFENADFLNANLLKIDTDGHDFEVLKGASGILAKNLPALLFECDSFEDPTYVRNVRDCFNSLLSFGYIGAIIYDNCGNLIGIQNLNNETGFDNLLFYQLSKNISYFDLLVLAEPELSQFFAREVEHFISRIGNQTNRSLAGQIFNTSSSLQMD